MHNVLTVPDTHACIYGSSWFCLFKYIVITFVAREETDVSSQIRNRFLPFFCLVFSPYYFLCSNHSKYFDVLRRRIECLYKFSRWSTVICIWSTDLTIYAYVCMYISRLWFFKNACNNVFRLSTVQINKFNVAFLTTKWNRDDHLNKKYNIKFLN